jgi:uncharacterized protein
MTDASVEHILRTYKTWAVVGCSPNPLRDSHDVAAFLQDRGYRVIPVNPSADEILGQRCYPDLASIPEDIDVEVVDIFRRSELAGVHVDEAIAIGAKAVWMQLDVIDQDAAQRAVEAGLHVAMDRCPKIELPRLSRARGV